MELHPMQIKTLHRVDQGRVYEIRGDGYYQIRNAGKGVLNSLLVLGLVKNKEDDYYFELTDAGRDAFAVAKKINSEAQSPVDNKASSS